MYESVKHKFGLSAVCRRASVTFTASIEVVHIIAARRRAGTVGG